MNFTHFSVDKETDDGKYICYCIEVDEQTIVNAIKNGNTTLKNIKETTQACTENECKEKNPKQRCYSVEINELIKIYSKKE